jgi:hypothetical protein
MRAILHILTRPDDSLAQEVIAAQRQRPDLQIKVVNLIAPEPDLRKLLEEIFTADSVEVW